MRKTTVKENENRRYIFNDIKIDYINDEFDVVIIGCGIAGIYSALHIDPSKKIAMINKGEIKSGSSYYAQGGIAAVMSKSDSYNLHIEDTLNAGAGLCDIEAVKVLVNEGPENIRELINLNVPFDVNSEGELEIGKEGGHRERRIVHCGGDATGKETTKQLYHIAFEKENIKFFFNTSFTDIILNEANNEVAGVILQDGKNTFVFETKNVILATGGIGQIYNYTTNPKGAVGDGISAAYRAGAVIESMEMVQFHPTTMIPHYETDRLFLISEAVRGEGGILRNRMGEAFMQGVHPMADLAPRDIVTRAIYKELLKSGDTYVFIDAGCMTKEFFAERFPTIYNECVKFNINVPEDFIPVRPAQHYHMGGIKTDLNGRTNIKGLYACGETASTGIHGANRLASNSMLECLVFGKRCALDINSQSESDQQNKDNLSADKINKIVTSCNKLDGNKLDVHQIKGFSVEIKNIMSIYVGAIRKVDGMLFALERIDRIMSYIDKTDIDNFEEAELYNMVQTAKMVTESALDQKENIGAHYVEDAGE
ncbi:MAG: L-aspartate oxidase [Oscillospiraceae bacterium]|nr:L-aspartate oxidase [Oscillospiraceae bacterium]